MTIWILQLLAPHTRPYIRFHCSSHLWKSPSKVDWLNTWALSRSLSGGRTSDTNPISRAWSISWHMLYKVKCTKHYLATTLRDLISPPQQLESSNLLEAFLLTHSQVSWRDYLSWTLSHISGEASTVVCFWCDFYVSVWSWYWKERRRKFKTRWSHCLKLIFGIYRHLSKLTEAAPSGPTPSLRISR